MLREEKGPSLFEWTIAFILFMFAFMSFCYSDTISLIFFELRFAQAILHFNLKEAYIPITNIISNSGIEINNFSVYDLPMNLLFGIWGIPLYLYSIRNGTLEITFPQSFWQMMYGKSILLVAFIFSAILVYKICRALDVNDKRSRWGAFIYLTSSMSVTAICIFGQFDIFSVCLTLLGFLAFIRRENKKFFVYFLLAVNFKQFAFFMMIPLMLMRDKNVLGFTGKMIMLGVFMLIVNLPIMMLPEVFSIRSGFASGILGELIGAKIPFVGGRASFLAVMFGALCVYCWFNKPEAKDEKRHIMFIMLASGIVLFTGFASRSYWMIHFIPYLAIAAAYNYHEVDRILLFETLGISMIVISRSYLSIVPDHAANMLIHNILGRPEFRGVKAAINTVVSTSQKIKASGVLEGSSQEGQVVFMKLIQSVFEAIYVVCMYTVLYLSRPFRNNNNKVSRSPVCSLRICAWGRLAVNAAICSFWILAVLIAILRR